MPELKRSRTRQRSQSARRVSTAAYSDAQLCRALLRWVSEHKLIELSESEIARYVAQFIREQAGGAHK